MASSERAGTVISGILAVTNRPQVELLYVWEHATREAQAIIVVLILFSIIAWSIMASKAVEMRRAKALNRAFLAAFRRLKSVTELHKQGLKLEGCPLLAVYDAGCGELQRRLKTPAAESQAKVKVTLKGMEHVKRCLESTVAGEALRLESGLILLAIAVSGAPFLGLLGTVWGVMSAFSGIAQSAAAGGRADLSAMAPGVSGALITTVAGLLVAIPSMFGYNWLVHNLRVLTVELDNFAQELVSQIETEYLNDDE